MNVSEGDSKEKTKTIVIVYGPGEDENKKEKETGCHGWTNASSASDLQTTPLLTMHICIIKIYTGIQTLIQQQKARWMLI